MLPVWVSIEAPLVGLADIPLKTSVRFLQDGGQPLAQRYDGRVGIVADQVLAEHDADRAEIGIIDGVASLIHEEWRIAFDVRRQPCNDI